MASVSNSRSHSGIERGGKVVVGRYGLQLLAGDAAADAHVVLFARRQIVAPRAPRDRAEPTAEPPIGRAILKTTQRLAEFDKHVLRHVFGIWLPGSPTGGTSDKSPTRNDRRTRSRRVGRSMDRAAGPTTSVMFWLGTQPPSDRPREAIAGPILTCQRATVIGYQREPARSMKFSRGLSGRRPVNGRGDLDMEVRNGLNVAGTVANCAAKYGCCARNPSTQSRFARSCMKP